MESSLNRRRRSRRGPADGRASRGSPQKAGRTYNQNQHENAETDHVGVSRTDVESRECFGDAEKQTAGKNVDRFIQATDDRYREGFAGQACANVRIDLRYHTVQRTRGACECGPDAECHLIKPAWIDSVETGSDQILCRCANRSADPGVLEKEPQQDG